jgi:hypothetical protein
MVEVIHQRSSHLGWQSGVLAVAVGCLALYLAPDLHHRVGWLAGH